jgi:hypothetical protein
MRPCLRLLCCLLAFTALAAGPARAATISGVSIVKNAGNSADFFDNVGAVASAVQSTVAVSSTSNSFDARYAAVVSADRGGSGGSGTTTQSFTGNFTITLSLTETSGTAWSFTLDVLRTGAQTIVSDGSGNASVALGALTGTETGAGSVSSGTLSLAALTTLSNASAPTTSPNTAFNQNASAVIAGVGTGSAQSIVLNYIFTASAVTVDPAVPGGDPQGDEAALRMGLNSALSSFTADDYPGIGLRNLATDGIFIAFRLIEAPEPDTALLLGLGLALLAWRRRPRYPDRS